MHYVKIWSSILDGSLADDYDARHVYEDLLKLANADGVVDMHPNAIAAKTRAPLEILLPALDRLSSPDPDSRTPDCEGRRIVLLHGRTWGWRIVNWHAYRELRTPDHVREQTRNRVARHRERTRRLGHGSADAPPDVTRYCNAVTHDVTPGRRKKEEREEDPPVGPPVAVTPSEPPGGAEPPSRSPLLIVVRVKPKSDETKLIPITDETVAAMEREFPEVDVRMELAEAVDWSLRQLEKPRRGKLWTNPLPGLRKWLRKATRDVRARGGGGPPKANPRAAVDAAWAAANGGATAGEGAEDGGAVDPITEHLEGVKE